MHEIYVAGKRIVVYPQVFEPYYVTIDDILFNVPELADCHDVLDVGTGTGILPLIWSEKFSNLNKIVGVDISEEAVRNAKTNTDGITKIEIRQSDLFTAIDKDEKFDAIVFNGPHADWEDQDAKRRFGPLYCALYDPALKTAARFFQDAGRYLTSNGFIIYTFSDYGDLKSLTNIIRDHGWTVTLLSILPFRNDRDVKSDVVESMKAPLWYNLKIRRKMSISELVDGFRKSVQTLSENYSRTDNTGEAFEEFLNKMILLLNCMFLQVDNWMAKDDWLISGFSLPSWFGREPRWEFLYSFGKGVDQYDREKFSLYNQKLAELIRGGLNNRIELVVNYFTRSPEWEIIVARLKDRYGIQSFEAIKKRLYEFKENDIPDLNAAQLTKEQLCCAIDNAKPMLSLFESSGKTEEHKVIRNLWLNFYTVRLGEKGLKYIYFRKIDYPTASINGSVYFACSFDPAVASHIHMRTVLSLLEEVIGIANIAFQGPIWIGIRNKYARHTAIAAIMARNRAHHYDSHIRPRIGIEDVLRRVRELKLKGGEVLPTFPDESEWKIIRLLRDRIDKYSSEKEFFIADILTEPLATTKRAMFYRDVILPIIQNPLFMDNIAANEGIQYLDLNNNKLRIRVFRKLDNNVFECSAAFSCDPGTPEAYSISYPSSGFPYSSHCDAQSNSGHSCHTHPNLPEVLQVSKIGRDDPPHQELEVEVELPGPLGEHAFYGFLENLIRNIAKHQKHPQIMEIRICISEPQDEDERDEFYTIDVWDNITDPDKKVDLNADGKQSITLKDTIEAFIKADIVTETGKPKPYAWGLAEMKVDAALLSGSTDWLRLEQFLAVRKAWEIFDGYLVADEPISKDVQPRLVYRFRLMKPKKLCAFLSSPLDNERVAEFKRNGFWIFTEMDDLENQLKDAQQFTRGKLRSLASFEIALLDLRKITDLHQSSQQVQRLIPYLPFRVIVIGDSSLRDLLPNSVQLCASANWLDLLNRSENITTLSKEIMDTIWLGWLEKWKIGSRQTHIHIYLQQLDQQRFPTKQWRDFANFFNAKEHPVKLVVWWGEKGKIKRSFVNTFNERTLTNIVYDRHGGLLENLDNDFCFYERIEKQNSDFVLFFAPKVLEEGGNVVRITPQPFEIAEAGLLRMLIIDERIAERVGEKVYNTPRGFCAAEAGIFIVTHFGYDKEPQPLHRQIERDDSNLGFPGFKVKVEPSTDDNNYRLGLTFSGVVKDYYSDRGFDCGFDMIIIHHGVLQTHFKTEAEQNTFLEALSKEIPFVVIDSGRGIPPEIQKNKRIKFLPFPILEQCLLGQDVAKLRLTTVAMKLTRKRES